MLKCVVGEVNQAEERMDFRNGQRHGHQVGSSSSFHPQVKANEGLI